MKKTKEGDDKTHPNLFILSASRKILSVRTKTDTANIEIPILANGFILKSGDILTGGHIENLGRTITAGREVFAVTTKPNTANDTVVVQVVNQVYVEHTLDLGVKNRIPVGTLLFLRHGQIIQIPVG